MGDCDYIVGPIASSYAICPAVLFHKPTFQMASAPEMPKRDDFKLALKPWINMTSGAG